MSSPTRTPARFGTLRSLLQPKQSDCCSIAFEATEEPTPAQGEASPAAREERSDPPKASGAGRTGCCGS